MLVVGEMLPVAVAAMVLVFRVGAEIAIDPEAALEPVRAP
jgi:hypothetical protein